MDGQYVAGVDIGGQTSKIGIVDAAGNVLARKVIRTDSYGKDAEAYMDALAGALGECAADAGLSWKAVGAVGIGAPNGNYYTGHIVRAVNIAWASGREVPLAEGLSRRLGGIPVTLTNDANAAAMGEMVYGAARNYRDFIMITLGTGVGSGIVVDGKLVYGHDGNAGELGHVIVDRNSTRSCGCGRKGCLETYCSATGVARTAKEWIETTDEPSLLRDMDELSSKTVYDAAKQGDAMAIRVLRYTAEILGRSLADFVTFSAPEAIVIFGGLARAWEFLYEPMLDEMNANLMPVWRGKIKIVRSGLKESDAAILGASALAWK